MSGDKIRVSCVVLFFSMCLSAEVLKVEEMTFMNQGFVEQNNNGGLYANTADFPTGTADARMAGYAGASRRGLEYISLSALGMGPVAAGTYTLTIQVARNNTSAWLGMIDTDTGGSFNLGSTGFAAGFFLTPDASDRVAYTLQNMDNFNNISGVSLTVTSDPALDILTAGANLAEDIWYDVTYTWTIDETATYALGKDAYIGVGGAISATASSLWIANSQLIYTAPGTVQVFPVIADLLGPNLIPNGEFETVTNKNPDDATILWNLAGTFGDYISAANRTADLVSWSPYYADPNNLIPAVGTPHVVDGDGELDGTFYLDTQIKESYLVLNSVMDYRNGIKAEDILNGVTIDVGKSYRFSVDAVGWDRPTATFTVALTDGTDVTNTANAITGSLMTDSLDNWGGARMVDISGADLQAAGQVNVIFDHVNSVAVPGYPGSVASGDVANLDLVSQILVYSVSLAEVQVAASGDVNKDGVVDQDDVDLANSYLDGSIDGGDDAATRQADLVAQGMTAAEALAYLNLTDFDINDDGSFDAADITDLQELAKGDPVILRMTIDNGLLDFVWNNNSGKTYDLEASTSLVLTNWLVYDGNTNIARDSSGTNSLRAIEIDGSVQFFRIIEK